MRIQQYCSPEKIAAYFSLIASALTIGFVIISAYKSQWELNKTSVLISLSVVIVILAVVDMYLVRRYDSLDRESRKHSHILDKDEKNDVLLVKTFMRDTISYRVRSKSFSKRSLQLTF